MESVHMGEGELNNNMISLTIELVPETCWFTNLRLQIQPKDWDFLGRMIYQKDNYQCEICGGRGNKRS